jgi:hypothetical protein
VVLRGLKDVSWGGAKSMMADGNFLRSLVEFDKDSLTEKQVGAVRQTETLVSPLHAPCDANFQISVPALPV